jgi:antitoxin CcdA
MRMASRASQPASRRATNVTLRTDLTEEARRLGLNVSHACESGLEAAVKKAREAEWLEANKDALEQWNEWVEKNGLPLAGFRQF